MSCIFFLVVLIGLFEFLSKEFPFVFISTLTDTVPLFSLIFFLSLFYMLLIYIFISKHHPTKKNPLLLHVEYTDTIVHKKI